MSPTASKYETSQFENFTSQPKRLEIQRHYQPIQAHDDACLNSRTLKQIFEFCYQFADSQIQNWDRKGLHDMKSTKYGMDFLQILCRHTYFFFTLNSSLSCQHPISRFDMSSAQAHCVWPKPIRRVMQLKLHKPTMGISNVPTFSPGLNFLAHTATTPANAQLLCLWSSNCCW